MNDYPENNANISEINPVPEITALDLVCPFISGDGNIVNCHGSSCMSWQWVASANDNMGICLML